MKNNSRELWGRLHETGRIVKRKSKFPLLKFKKGMKVLDVGCGSGSDLNYLKNELGLECYGVDIALDKTSIKRVSGVIFILADASYLPFKENSFDVVYSLGTIEHTCRTYESIQDSLRVLKYGGQVTHTVPNIFSLHTFIARPLLKGLKRWHLGLEQSFSIFQFYKMFRSSGFEKIRYHTLLFNPDLVSKQFSSSGRTVHLFKTLDNAIANLFPFWGSFIAMNGTRLERKIAA